jgi:sigma-B regulation protein RsbU (phosphoserine phosphatase)
VVSLSLITDSKNQAGNLTDRLIALEGQLESKNLQMEYVATTGLMLTSLLDIEKVLSAMMEMAIRTVSGEVGCILLEKEGELQTKISWGLDQSIVETISTSTGEKICLQARQTGRAVVVNEIATDQGGLAHVNAAIAVPLVTRNHPMGLLVVVNKTEGGGFDDNDKLMIETLVRFASVAIDNASLLEQQLEQQRLEQELQVAKQVQQALLPKRSASLTRARVETSYQPAGHVGGDYFDVIKLNDHEFVVIVGDVSNKGVPAALLMTAVRSVFRLETRVGIVVEQLLDRLNSFLCDQVFSPNSMFITLAYAYFDLKQGTCTCCNAGHLPPIHISRSNSEISQWKVGGTALGLFSDFKYSSERVKLTPGDRVLFYTDGITECRNQLGELYGRERLEESVRKHRDLGQVEMLHALLVDASIFVSGKSQPDDDDITVLLVEIEE